MQASRRSHVTPLLRHLHWLPISYRCQFKVLMLTYKILSNTAPVYLRNLISEYSPSRSLRSADQKFLKRTGIPKNSFGQRSFSNIAPVLWNGLPAAVRKAKSLKEFKSKLKTHFFVEHYGSDPSLWNISLYCLLHLISTTCNYFWTFYISSCNSFINKMFLLLLCPL